MNFGILTITMLSIIIFTSAVANANETKTIFVGSQLVDCVGVSPQKCMQIRDDPNSKWSNFYSNIEGFVFVEGKEYKVIVKITDIVDPPTDASSKKYELIEILGEKNSSRHIPYKNLCAPGYVSLGKICVLNDRCGPGIYAGKICYMDGVKQPYLKPSQQGRAGIVAADVICAEHLQLVFKYDASPICVKPESVSILENRGWYSEIPPIACTLEYDPICGMNNFIYGNLCAANADHIAIKYKGECIK